MTLSLKILSEDIFNDLKSRAAKFTNKRGWQKYHNPKNLSMAITIEAAELMEIFQWWTPQESMERSVDKNMKTDIEGEIADIIIYILHLSNILNINLEEAVKTKLAFNDMRFTNDVVSELERNNFRNKG